jgi:hypothetical protein
MTLALHKKCSTSEPEADRGPRAGSLRGVVVATGGILSLGDERMTNPSFQLDSLAGRYGSGSDITMPTRSLLFMQSLMTPKSLSPNTGISKTSR